MASPTPTRSRSHDPGKPPEKRAGPGQVYICLLNWRSWHDTIECLETLFRIDHPSYRVVVCDNGSEDGSLDHIAAWAGGSVEPALPLDRPLRALSHPPVAKPVSHVLYHRAEAEAGGLADEGMARLVLIQTGENLGFAGGNNVALRYGLARGDMEYAWLINNDAVVEPAALSALIARMERSPRLGMCGSTIYYYRPGKRVQCLAGGRFRPWTARSIFETRALSGNPDADRRRVEQGLDFIYGASLIVRRACLERIGLIDETFFMNHEDLDWSLRCRGQFGLGFAPGSVVYHKYGGSWAQSRERTRHSLRADRIHLENKLVITRKHFPKALSIVRLSFFAIMLKRLLLGQPGHLPMILDVLRRDLRAGWRGSTPASGRVRGELG